MSVLARRARDEDHARRRALLELRGSVVAAVTRDTPLAGSLAVDEAVDEGLAQMLKGGGDSCDLEQAQRWWIAWAKLRMIDKLRLAGSRYRDPIPVDEHPAALAQGTRDDPLELAADGLDAVALREILSSLSGPQREWADGLLDGLLHPPLDDGTPVPKLHEVLGWSAEKTRKTGQRARQTIKVFIEDRASGVICSRRQAVLDAFILASEPRYRNATHADVDHRQFQAVVVHLAGCPECQAVWNRRRSTLLARLGAAALVPVDAIAAAAQAFAGKLAGLASSAQNAALALLARLGIGGGAAVGGASAITGKTAAVCVGIVCAAGATAGELTGVLGPLPGAPLTSSRQVAPKRAQAPAPKPTQPPAATVIPRTPVVTAPPPPAATRQRRRSSTPPTRTSASTSRASRVAAPPAPAPAPPAANRAASDYTPGDLPPGGSARAVPPPPPPPVASGPSCVPGDLGC